MEHLDHRTRVPVPDPRELSEHPMLGRALSTFGQELLKLVPSFLLVTLTGGLLSQCYQQRAATAALHAQEVAANRLAASELHRDLSELLGRRLYILQLSSTWAADTSRRPFIPPEQIVEARRWYESASRYRASVCRFFGPTSTLRLQSLILDMDYVEGLRGLERAMAAGRMDARSAAEAFPEAVGGADSLRSRRFERLDSLSAEVYLFDLSLVDRISRGEFAAQGGPRCADSSFRTFERMSAPLWRMRFLVDPRDTVAPRRTR